MPPGKINIQMTGEEANLFRAMQKIERAEKAMDEGLVGIGKSSRKAAKEQAALAAAARRTFREAATPQQKYVAKFRELQNLLAKDKISVALYGQAHKKAHAEMVAAIARTSGASQEAAEAARENARQKAEAVRQTAAIARAAAQRNETLAREAAQRDEALARRAKQIRQAGLTAQERYNQKLRELKTLLRADKLGMEDYGRATRRARVEMEEAGRAGKKTFGAQAIQQLGAFALGYVGISKAIGTATMALREMEQVRKEAGQRVRESRMGLGSLAQLADTDQEMIDLVAKAKAARAAGAVESVGEGARLVFSLESAGALDDFDLFKQMGATGLTLDPATLAKSGKTLLKSMGEGETGGMRAIVSKAFGASAASPATAEALLEAASRGAGSAAALGLSDEELLAATAQVATASGTAELGGTRVASFLKSLETAEGGGFEGKSLAEMVKQVEAKGLRGEELFKYFGRAEAVQAFRVMRDNLADLERQIGVVRQAEKTDVVGQKLRRHAALPELRAGRMAERARAGRELGEEGLGTRNLVAQAVQDTLTAESRREGKSETRIWLANQLADAWRFFHGDQQFSQSLAGLLPDERMGRDVLDISRQPLAAPNRDLGGVPGGATGARIPGPAGDLQVVADAQRENSEALRETNRLLQAVVDRPDRNPVLGRPNEDEPLGAIAQ